MCVYFEILNMNKVCRLYFDLGQLRFDLTIYIEIQVKTILSFGTDSSSWWETNGPGCKPIFFPNRTSEDDLYRSNKPDSIKECIVDFHYVEAIQAIIHIVLAVRSSLLNISSPEPSVNSILFNSFGVAESVQKLAMILLRKPVAVSIDFLSIEFVVNDDLSAIILQQLNRIKNKTAFYHYTRSNTVHVDRKKCSTMTTAITVTKVGKISSQSSYFQAINSYSIQIQIIVAPPPAEVVQ